MTQNKPFFIGITGGVGAGKTEVLHFIRTHYRCEIYLADEVAHEIQKPGTCCYEELVSLLGPEVLLPDGMINRSAMADRIFSDPKLLDTVNGIIHPAVKTYLLSRLEQAKSKGVVELFFVEAALLIEGGYKELVDELWYIYADEKVRADRLSSVRGYSSEKIKSIIAHQLSEQSFRENCDFVINNSGDLADTYKQIKEKLEAYTWQE